MGSGQLSAASVLGMTQPSDAPVQPTPHQPVPHQPVPNQHAPYQPVPNQAAYFPPQPQPQLTPGQGQSVWRGPGNYWISQPLGYAVIGAVLGLILAIVVPFSAQSEGRDMETSAILLTAIGMPGVGAVATAIFWIPTLIVLLLLGGRLSVLGDSAGKVLGLLAAVLGAGLGFLIAAAFGQMPMIGLALGFFGTLILMNIGQAIGRSLFFRKPRACLIGGIVFAVLIVAAVVAQVVSVSQG